MIPEHVDPEIAEPGSEPQQDASPSPNDEEGPKSVSCGGGGNNAAINLNVFKFSLRPISQSYKQKTRKLKSKRTNIYETFTFLISI